MLLGMNDVEKYERLVTNCIVSACFFKINLLKYSRSEGGFRKIYRFIYFFNSNDDNYLSKRKNIFFSILSYTNINFNEKR